MTRVLVLGATGRAGCLILTNLADTTEGVAGLRHAEDVARLPKSLHSRETAVIDLDSPTSLRVAAEGADVVVNAIRLREDIAETALVNLHEHIRNAVCPEARIVTVGGAGALRLPDGRRFWQSPLFPRETLPRGRAHAALRDHLESHEKREPWVYLIPPPAFDPDGFATGRYQIDSPSPDESDFTTRAISYADYARAVADAVNAEYGGTMLVSGRTE